MQLRLKGEHSHDEYVTREGWRKASLRSCPLHPGGGCGFRACGSYTRKAPEGVVIRRWYCPTGHCTFSLIPDFVAARVPSSLIDIEDAVASVEAAVAAGISKRQAAHGVRPEVEIACRHPRPLIVHPTVLPWV